MTHYTELGWEPRIAQGTLTTQQLLMPFTRAWSKITILTIFLNKNGPTQHRFLKPNYSLGVPEFPNQNLEQIGQGVPEL